jgi:hypothetical protein
LPRKSTASLISYFQIFDLQQQRQQPPPTATMKMSKQRRRIE